MRDGCLRQRQRRIVRTEEKDANELAESATLTQPQRYPYTALLKKAIFFLYAKHLEQPSHQNIFQVSVEGRVISL